jgi:hypothetical protein
MERLDANNQDITMLWLLKRPQWIQQCKAGRELVDWLENIMGVPQRVAKTDEFQEAVSARFQGRGVRAVAPDRVVDDWRKDGAKELCLAAKWPKPFFPVMLQTRPGAEGGTGAFIIFSSWQDAALALAEMSRTHRYKGKKKVYAADMVYENQLVDMRGYDYPCRIILDCDAKVSEFRGKYSVGELNRIIDGTAEWFARRLLEINAIHPEDTVIVYEKEKSREGKASRHLIFNILGFSTWDTQAVFAEIFGVEWDKLKALEAKPRGDKREARFPIGGGIPAWRLVDPVPHHGRGQYSVLGFYDPKKGEREYPCLTRRLVIVNGNLTECRLCRVDRKSSDLNSPTALKLLHRACYTSFISDFITLNPTFMTQRTVGMFADTRCETRTHTHPLVTGKKKGGRGPKRWTKRARLRWRNAIIPAPVDAISDFQDLWRQGWACEHDNVLPRLHPHHATEISPWGEA